MIGNIFARILVLNCTILTSISFSSTQAPNTHAHPCRMSRFKSYEKLLHLIGYGNKYFTTILINGWKKLESSYIFYECFQTVSSSLVENLEHKTLCYWTVSVRGARTTNTQTHSHIWLSIQAIKQNLIASNTWNARWIAYSIFFFIQPTMRHDRWLKSEYNTQWRPMMIHAESVPCVPCLLLLQWWKHKMCQGYRSLSLSLSAENAYWVWNSGGPRQTNIKKKQTKFNYSSVMSNFVLDCYLILTPLCICVCFDPVHCCCHALNSIKIDANETLGVVWHCVCVLASETGCAIKWQRVST